MRLPRLGSSGDSIARAWVLRFRLFLTLTGMAYQTWSGEISTGANSIWFLPNIGATASCVFIKDATTQHIIYNPSPDWKIVGVGGSILRTIQRDCSGATRRWIKRLSGH
jgi:hypothetical protein